MNPEDVGRILDEIGERIGPAGEYAWTLTVRQVYIDAWVWLGVGLAAFLVTLALAIAAYRWNLRKIAKIDQAIATASEAKGGFYVSLNSSDEPVAFIVTLLGVPASVGLIAIGTSLPVLLNPEYHAMVRLLDRLVPR